MTTSPLPEVLLSAVRVDERAGLLRAYDFAAAAHAGQLRDEGTPFIEHPVRVAVILATELDCPDAEALAAALNHDVLEDCPDISRAELAGVIGERACAIVCDVTKWPVAPEHKAARDRAYLDSLPLLGHTSRLVKLADRIDNLRAVTRSGDPEKARRYLAVSLDEFVPLAEQTDQRATQLVLEACDAIAQYLKDGTAAGSSEG